MKTLMRNGRDRRSENPRCATRAKSACFWLGPISGSHQGPQPQRLHSEAGYMAAPERFAETSDSFPLQRGRRPYMALLAHSLMRRDVRSWWKLTWVCCWPLVEHATPRPPIGMMCRQLRGGKNPSDMRTGA